MQQHNSTAKGISDDISLLRSELRSYCGDKYLTLFELNVWRPIFAILFDWLLIAIMVVLVLDLRWWIAPCAVLVIANRQRALGNILHDAGHSNLHRSRQINDTLATALVAPLIFADLKTYRDTHFRHHQQLGSGADPDKLSRPLAGSWPEHYRTHLMEAKLWLESLVGHLANASVPGWRKIYIICWWALACSLLWIIVGEDRLAVFLALWMISRATAFHAITIFREMCDHYGLVEGGIISFTRDIIKKNIWFHLIHPRNNGYHLTHHLLPAAPYYKLPLAQQLCAMTPTYRKQCQVCDSYIIGQVPVVEHWPQKTNS